MSSVAVRRARPRVLPGFGLSLGYSIAWVSALVLFPLAVLSFRTAALGFESFAYHAFSDRAMASYKVTFFCSLAAAVINTLLALPIAWTLARQKFPGRSIIDALVDLPIALPTAVSGIALTTLFAEKGWVGSWFAELGVKISFTPLGITIALMFITLPLAVRTLQPVIEELDAQQEEASISLGASWKVTFWKVLFPYLKPAMLTSLALCLARALGEYGSVVFIAGNMPMKTEIAPLLIITRLEEFDYPGAMAIAVMLLLSSFVFLIFLNILQWRSVKRYARAAN